MKISEELNALKKEVEVLNRKPAELTDDEVMQVTGGAAGIGDNNQVDTRIINLLINQLDLNTTTINGNSAIVDDLGADSLDVVDILQTLEEEFKITIPETRFFALKTVDDLSNLIEEILNQ